MNIKGAFVRTIAVSAVATLIGLAMSGCGDSGNPAGGGGGGLAAPAALSAVAVSSTEIQLSWNAVAGAAGYNVYYSLSSSAAFQLMGTSQTTSTSHSGRSPNTSYYYKVAAFNANGAEGTMSSIAYATTLNSGGNATYAVTYNGNDNTGGTAPTDPTRYSSGATVTILGNNGNLTKTGYTFAGWNAMANGSGANYDAGLTFTISANVTLYAQWTASGPTPTYSLDGVWGDASGFKVIFSGSTGTISAFGNLGNSHWRDAVDKGYIKLSDPYWRSITSTGNLTWSGQQLGVSYNASNPNVATGTVWANCTITMSADGQTITVVATYTSGTDTKTYTRKR